MILPIMLVTIIYWMSGILDDFGVYIEILFTYVFVTHISVAYGKNRFYTLLFYN